MFWLNSVALVFMLPLILVGVKTLEFVIRFVYPLMLGIAGAFGGIEPPGTKLVACLTESGEKTLEFMLNEECAFCLAGSVTGC